ncbi:TPR-like protein [Stereum hirsutum FP-91666 SS1]|uniref:TPR-like protein n=1 Tax=Stereum hirsutum (strain FP-91666) TaxID=721885 RepID=UPI000440F242|nr:TPR-like protein [Stereum hirsutum FP-91666 SS1]EIM87497.1 TPR-like protein [Stereum hirsutum FP-91666 SS1]
MSDLTSALQRLANYRSHNTRASKDVFESGVVVLKQNAINKLGDDSWSFLEQLALAAIDVGRYDVADECLKRLAEKFPASPRVDCLQGIFLEGTQSPQLALKYYGKLLETDPANALNSLICKAAWKRRISVLRRLGQIETAVTELTQFLDTFYNDVEGWLELADIYTSCNQYTLALQALSHVLILSPQNPFYVLQAAETAYTLEDIPLAIKWFLLVVDMTTDEDAQKTKPTGIIVRAWYGIALCSRRLKSPSGAHSQSNTSVPKDMLAIVALARDVLLDAYEKRKGTTPQGTTEVLKWLEDFRFD